MQKQQQQQNVISYGDVFDERVVARRFDLQPLFFVRLEKQIDGTMSVTTIRHTHGTQLLAFKPRTTCRHPREDVVIDTDQRVMITSFQTVHITFINSLIS